MFLDRATCSSFFRMFQLYVINMVAPFSAGRSGHAAVVEPVGRRRLWLIGGRAAGPATQALSLHPAPLRTLALECAAAAANRADGGPRPRLPKSLEEEMEELASGRETGGRGTPSGPARMGKKKRAEEEEGWFPKIRKETGGAAWGLVRSESSTRGC